MKAKLKDLIDGLEVQSDDVTSYLNTRTGEIVVLTSEDERLADHGVDSDAHGWMKEAADLVAEVQNSDDYIRFPDSWSMNEYEMMSDFCHAQPDGAVRERLLFAIHSKGAFRRFKDMAFDLGVIDQWYEYRWKCYEEVAVKWCRENEIEVIS